MLLKTKLSKQIPVLREEIKSFLKTNGERVVDEVKIEQIYGGMRSIKSLVCDTSNVPPEKGLIIRGRPISELVGRLPEEVLFLLLTGDLPTSDELKDLSEELSRRASVPEYVWNVLDAMPHDAHPMCMLNTAILCMEGDSIFRKRYDEGMKKDDYWDATLEDTLTLIARLPIIAAWVYRKRYNKGKRIDYSKDLDWGTNYARMLGLDDPTGNFAELMRLYLVLHSDHESGNVSAMTTATVNSALSDLYYSLSAGLNGLAGPLHGLANQECLKWVISLSEKWNGVPSDEDLRKYAWDTLSSGKVIPGYGHAVLRVTDPRFTAFLNFGKTHCQNGTEFKIVEKVFNVVPAVLKEHGKAKNPWPNVDAGSGALLYYYGLTEFDYYTVLFSVSRALGVCAQAVVSRAMGYPIIRPKSVTTEWVKSQATKGCGCC